MYKCNYCDKVYKHKPNKFAHQKRCQNKPIEKVAINIIPKNAPLAPSITAEIKQQIVEEVAKLAQAQAATQITQNITNNIYLNTSS